jgi:hypothetical protein
MLDSLVLISEPGRRIFLGHASATSQRLKVVFTPVSSIIVVYHIVGDTDPIGVFYLEGSNWLALFPDSIVKDQQEISSIKFLT